MHSIKKNTYNLKRINQMKVLVTGFIGSESSIRLLNRGFEAVGIDNDYYYDLALKEARLVFKLHAYQTILKDD